MVITTSRRMPVALAYTAALLFTLASGSTNLVYGWGEDIDLPVIWAVVFRLQARKSRYTVPFIWQRAHYT